MSYRPRGGGIHRGRGGGGARGRGGGARGRGWGGARGEHPYDLNNELERQKFMTCWDFGISYPPDPSEVFGLVEVLKHNGEVALHINDLPTALALYSNALLAVEMFPTVRQIVDEHHKILCNRSLVCLRMRMFKEAEQDAISAIASCSSFIKGYWRASQAVKDGHEGIQQALPYIVEGLRRALIGEGNAHDVVTFLTELCILVPKAPVTDALDSVLENLTLPDTEKDDDVWMKVLQKLSSGRHWESISMLILGVHDGPRSELKNIGQGIWSCSCVSVGSMLETLGDGALKNWGISLAISLIKQGASVDEIGQKHRKPTLHVGVNIALRTANLELLDCMLEEYSDDVSKKNSQDSDGHTALHVLVMSGCASTSNGEAIMDLLLEHQCDANIRDKLNKRPIDYLSPSEGAFKKLLYAGKSVEELRKELESLKARGNAEQKFGNHQLALKLYSEAIQLSEQSKKLYKEAAILYSNRANVFYTLEDHNEVLTNAIAATNCDSTWHKGHWWKAKVLYYMGNFDDAFSAYMDGYVKSSVATDVKFNFLMEALMLLKQIPSDNFMSCYNQLRFLDRDMWPVVLSRLSDSRTCDWKCIAYLILGSNLDKSRFGCNITGDTIESLCTGVAGAVSTDDVQASTVFQYLVQHEAKKCAYWLDAALFAVYHRGNTQTLKSLARDDEDTSLHAAVRFALLTGRTNLIEVFSIQEPGMQNSVENGCGDSVFHTVTKQRPLPESIVLEKVTQLLLKKGLSVIRRDRREKLPVEYLDNHYPGDIFDIFFKARKVEELRKDLESLKTRGNAELKSGNHQLALKLYSEAIQISEQSKNLYKEAAILYSARAKVFYTLEDHKEVLTNAIAATNCDSTWHKGHWWKAKALYHMSSFDDAFSAYMDGYIKSSVAADVKFNFLMEARFRVATSCLVTTSYGF